MRRQPDDVGRGGGGPRGLSDREQQIFELLALGHTARQIAERLSQTALFCPDGTPDDHEIQPHRPTPHRPTRPIPASGRP